MKFIITGCPRSGTGFMAELFRSNGIECGHEQYIDHSKQLDPPVGESSWMAAPFLEDYKKKGYTIIHVIRRPIDCIRSMIQHESFKEDTPYGAFKVKHFRKFSGGSLIGFQDTRAVDFWYYWNRWIHQWADHTVYLNYLEDVAELFRRVTQEEPLNMPRTDINNKGPVPLVGITVSRRWLNEIASYLAPKEFFDVN